MDWDALEAAKAIARSPGPPDVDEVVRLAEENPLVLTRTIHLRPLFITVAQRVAASPGAERALEALVVACQTCFELWPLHKDLIAILKSVHSPLIDLMPLMPADRRPTIEEPVDLPPIVPPTSRTFDEWDITVQLDAVSRWETLEEATEALDSSTALLEVPELRIAAAQQLFQIMSKPEVPLPDLRGNSVVSQWIRGCLKSSSATLRAVTTRIVSAYFSRGSLQLQAKTLKFIDGLGLTLEQSVPADTVLAAWAQAGTTAEDEVLERILLQLVTALRLPHTLSTLASHHLRVLAKRRSVTPWQLCSPFWRTISLVVVRQCVAEREFVARFCSVVGVSRADLMLRTVQWTLPDLCLLDERLPALDTVAEALGKTRERLCLDWFSNIVAQLLLQNSFGFAEQRFLKLCPAIRTVGFSRLLKSNLVDVVYALLKLEKTKTILERIAPTLAGSAVLHLVHKFSETMRNLQGRQPYTMKRQCVRGLGVLVELYEAQSALRQIMTFLQSALATPQLIVDTMRVWAIVVERIGPDSSVSETIVDLTFAVVNQNYTLWPEEAQDIARTIVERVYELCPDYIVDNGAPPVPFDVSKKLSQGLERSSEQKLIDALRRGAQHENKYIARQTVQDIIAHVLTADFDTDLTTGGYAGQVIRLLVDFAGKYGGDVPDLCAQALGLVGALDPSRVELPPHNTPKPPVATGLLKTNSEVAEFSVHIVQHHMLKTFEAATDPAMQQFLAFGIQELLKLMGMSSLTDLRTKFEPGTAQSLEPFLTTKYTLSGNSNGINDTAPRLSHRQYPIFDSLIDYNAWLEAFAYDQLCRASSVNIGRGSRLFDICRKVARADPELWAVLLGPASLVAVSETSDNRRAFLTEVSVILGRSVASMDTEQFHGRIFAVLDYFAMWLRERRQKPTSNMSDTDRISAILGEIPASLMAQRSFECQAYPRAIRYYEQTIRENAFDSEPAIWEALRLMYAELQDVDSLEGVSQRFAAMTIEQQVLSHRAAQNWDAAIVCYDVLGSWDALGRLESLQNSGREKDVLLELRSTTEQDGRADMGVQCAWSTADWQALEHWTKLAPRDSVIGLTGQALSAIKDRDTETLPVALDDARHLLITRGLPDPGSLSTLSQLRRTSLMLHALADVESIAALTLDVPVHLPTQKPDAMSQHAEVLGILDQRLFRAGSDFEAQRLLLSVRRAAFAIAGTSWGPPQMKHTFLLEAKFARKHGKNPRIALECVLKAGTIAGKNGNGEDDGDVVQEHARLLWSQGDLRKAIQMLRTQLDPAWLDRATKHTPKSLEAARTFLKYTSWLEQAAQAPSQDLAAHYAAITKMAPRWAKAHYRQGKYYSRLYDSQPTAFPRTDGSWALLIVQSYTKVLELDSNFGHLGECLPRLLTIWLDLGTLGDSGTGSAYRKTKSDKATQEIGKWSLRVSPRVLYQGLPQLLSRLNHPNAKVAKVMVSMIRRVVEDYTAQSLWQLLEVTESSDQVRRERALAIFRDVSSAVPEADNIRRFVDSLRRLCTYQHPRNDETSVRLSQLPFNAATLPCDLAVPFQSQMERAMPADELVSIYKIDDSVSILVSMQRPKRVTFWGSNGLSYSMLLKGTDDVRKDARLIEFTTAVNRMLFANPESRARQLSVVLYRVTPLSDKSGIIEWVPHAEPARRIIDRHLHARKLSINLHKLMPEFDLTLSIERRLANFQRLCHEYPPVLYEWFLEMFPEPVAWLAARARYGRTLAVMSIVGYILGLGDRHLENILLLRDSGAVLHVDFECLFEKGKDLKYPEIVPFRLTQNLVDALGIVNGYEGPFRRVCELTLGLIRAEEDLLMTILEAFVHDPVVLSKGRTPEQAISSTRDRLRGVKVSDAAPLSVSGQVEDLIRQAVDPKKLCQMYIGWAAFL